MLIDFLAGGTILWERSHDMGRTTPVATPSASPQLVTSLRVKRQNARPQNSVA